MRNVALANVIKKKKSVLEIARETKKDIKVEKVV